MLKFKKGTKKIDKYVTVNELVFFNILKSNQAIT